jgi:hypothetical protein
MTLRSSDIASKPDNFDLKYEKIIRWLTLLFLLPQFCIGAMSFSTYIKPSVFWMMVFLVPFVAQIVFMVMYAKLDRKWRSVGMVLDYIALFLGILFTLLYLYLFIGESRRITP